MIVPRTEKPERLGLDLDNLRRNSWKAYAIRFAFGGAITALTGVIAHTWGPSVGGLFLAFPAILPASITLVQDHGGKSEAGMDALGAAFGTIGLIVFGVVIWIMAPRYAGWLDLLVAGILWLMTSIVVWVIVIQRPSKGGGHSARTDDGRGRGT